VFLCVFFSRSVAERELLVREFVAVERTLNEMGCWHRSPSINLDLEFKLVGDHLFASQNPNNLSMEFSSNLRGRTSQALHVAEMLPPRHFV
jgi:hypothetical protein